MRLVLCHPRVAPWSIGHGMGSPLRIEEATSRITRARVRGLAQHNLQYSVERVRKHLLMALLNTIYNTAFVAFAVVVMVTGQARLSTPAGFLTSDSPDAGDPMLRGHRFMGLLNTIYNTAFVASLVVIMLFLMSRTVLRHGSCALWVCTGAALVGLTGAFAIGGLLNTIYSTAFVASLIITKLLMSRTVPRCSWCAATFVALLNTVYNTVFVVCTGAALVGLTGAFAMILDLLGQIGAFAAGSCSKSKLALDGDDPNRLVKRNNTREATWRVASAAPHHMTGNQSLLVACAHNGDGQHHMTGIVVHPATSREVPLRVQGSGSVRTESITLDDVWYVPGLDSNLVSTGQLARQGCAINLGPGGCRITRGGVLLGTARFTEACQFELDFLMVAASSTR